MLERIASLNDLRYEKINGDEGNIGLITNGYGLSLATTDLLDQMGGKAANYFDLTGGGSIDDILQGFDLMEYDKRVKVVLINLFGGILDIKPVAEGIIKSVHQKVTTKPLVIRVRGNWEDEVHQLLREYINQKGSD